MKIGIDVGGTFTHAVALSVPGLKLLAHSQVPTTHGSPEGVAAGIVAGLRDLMSRAEFGPERVAVVAHSTTQATNALLEGDLAPVGVVGLGAGMEAGRAARETNIGSLPLAQGRRLEVRHAFVDTSSPGWSETAAEAVGRLADSGIGAVVAAGAFSVDDPSFENRVLEAAARLGVPATATHQISGLYGLRVRTRTAVVNAGILPVMLETARRTEEGVRRLGIEAPVMVVRSDGGVMSLEQMMLRPIFTILSGPAAGVAAAMTVAGLSTGVFVEVGGTSTDISALVRGRAATRSADIGGHRLYLDTLDVRTVGAAGGSLVRLGAGKIKDVGPRSAHIAGAGYASFSESALEPGWRLETLSPRPGDPDDYAVFTDDRGRRLAVTATCAANALGLTPEGDWAAGNRESARKLLAALGERVGLTAEAAAAGILDLACGKIAAPVRDLVGEYGMESGGWRLALGGGAAGVYRERLARLMGRDAEIAPHAAVISAIGAATAMIQDRVEKNSTDPSPDEIMELRRRAVANVVNMGADPGSVEVFVQVDASRNRITVTARGSMDFEAGRPAADRDAAPGEIKRRAAEELGFEPGELDELDAHGIFRLFRAARETRTLLGLGRKRRELLAVADSRGVVRLALPNGKLARTDAAGFESALARFLDDNITYSEGGEKVPEVFVLTPERILEFNALSSRRQIERLAAAEIGDRAGAGELVILGVFGGR